MDPMPITLHTDTVELPEQTELATSHIRDEFQKGVDADVETLKFATAKAGWPAHDATKLFHRYVVSADDKAELKSVIRRACVLHKVEAAFYKDAKTEAGHISVKFHVSRKLNKENKPVADDTLDDNGKPKVAKAS
jgi:hypothetical protein